MNGQEPEFWEEKCDRGDAEVCWLVGGGHERGGRTRFGYFSRDPSRAARFYERGCRLGHPGSCHGLGLLLKHGSGVAADNVAAASLFQDACRRGHNPACVSIAYALRNGDGVRQDPDLADAVFREACIGGSALACSEVGTTGTLNLGSNSPAPAGAAGFFFGSTILDARSGCERAGFLWSSLPGPKLGFSCSGSPGNLGFQAEVSLVVCRDGRVCAIAIHRYLPGVRSADWVREYQSIENRLRARYGEPLSIDNKVPQSCLPRLGECVESRDAAVGAFWSWPNKVHLYSALAYANNTPGIGVLYVNERARREGLVQGL